MASKCSGRTLGAILLHGFQNGEGVRGRVKVSRRQEGRAELSKAVHNVKTRVFPIARLSLTSGIAIGMIRDSTQAVNLHRGVRVFAGELRLKSD